MVSTEEIDAARENFMKYRRAQGRSEIYLSDGEIAAIINGAKCGRYVVEDANG